ncbi:MAG TPA: GNAT family N-acetyltransferase [Thermoanaerobaculia bacterium]
MTFGGGTSSSVRLVVCDSPERWAAARRLVEEYASSLGVDLGFQHFENEVNDLPREYGRPDGVFLLAEKDGRWLGCIGLRKLEKDVCEMKRLYVVAGGRGHGVGRTLAEAIIERAKELGYKRMVLDTLPFMKDAQALYFSLGFEPIPAYRFNPIAGSAFLERKL